MHKLTELVKAQDSVGGGRCTDVYLTSRLYHLSLLHVPVLLLTFAWAEINATFIPTVPPKILICILLLM